MYRASNFGPQKQRFEKATRCRPMDRAAESAGEIKIAILQTLQRKTNLVRQLSFRSNRPIFVEGILHLKPWATTNQCSASKRTKKPTSPAPKPLRPASFLNNS
jgi:hypothetical protein